MYYELYIDVVFLVNFMMDTLLLFSVNQVLKCTKAYGRIFLSGALTSILTCVLLVTPIPNVIKLLCFHIVINTMMILIGLGIKRKDQFLKAFCMLYIASFFFGGVLQAIHPYVRMGSLFYVLAVCCYYLFRGVWVFLTRIKRMEEKRCEITLYTDSGMERIWALVDTGNVLEDPLSGNPISVLDKAIARRILSDADVKNFHYVPYRTVGKESVMPVFRIQKMCIHLKEETWIEKPMIGVSEGRVSEQETYQMILNPDVLGGI